MKTGPFTPKPGDLFRWHYDFDDAPCYETDQLYSTPMKRWVTISGTNLLISLTQTDIWWLNTNRFIHARVDDTATNIERSGGDRTHPRK